MRPLKFLPAILALTLAAPVFADDKPARPAAAAAAKKKAGGKNGAKKREQKIAAALKAQGVDAARTKRVMAVLAKHRETSKSVREDAKKHRQTIKTSTDQAAIARAKEGLEAAKTKRTELRGKRDAELGTILKPAELAKLKEVMQRGKKKGDGKRGAKNAGKSAKTRSS